MKRFHYPLDRLLRLKRQQLVQSETAIKKSSLQIQQKKSQVSTLREEQLRISERITLGDAANIMRIQSSSQYLQARIEQLTTRLVELEANHKNLLRHHRQLDGKIKAWESMRASAFSEFCSIENRKAEHELELRILGERYRAANAIHPARGASE